MAYTQQPGAHPGMSVGGNRNAKNLPVGPDGREWSNGLFGCFGACGTCLVACCCPCITYGKVKHRYEHLNSKGYPDPEHGGGCCNSDCMIHGLLMWCGFGFILQMGNRANIRGRYNVKGGPVGDCCASFCCTPCELVQESQELELEEKSFGKSG
ncbi:PLAC8 family-domain-containing protein [Panaeolus papilionaceus]|nr:PLAC8 family-domain-containing protein [Panaeolus papilionaceus]